MQIGSIIQCFFTKPKSKALPIRAELSRKVSVLFYVQALTMIFIKSVLPLTSATLVNVILLAVA